MTTLFISDLHLLPGREDLTLAFLRFLQNEASTAEGLYILGDFFEVWLGDDHSTDFNSRIIDGLANLAAPKYLMHGNRDFLLGEGFCTAAGATLLPDPVVIDLYGERVLLMHGDSLCTRDEAYMQVRQLLRSEAFQQDFLAKPIEERAAFARGAREQSQAHTGETASDIMDVTPDEVVRVMAAHGVQRLIHGHTHRPDVHKLEVNGAPAERIVLGDWDKTGWCLRVTPDGFDLKAFAL
ncbi:MAG: UDP-2,3-diacylglucosamine diphosphatase [Pseudomonadota bacterium]